MPVRKGKVVEGSCLGKRVHVIIGMLVLIIVFLLVLYAFIEPVREKVSKYLQRAPMTLELNTILTPLSDRNYITVAKSLKDVPQYKTGVNVRAELREYIVGFSSKKYDQAATTIIGFQEKINGLDLDTALEIDEALAKSIQTAAKDVKASRGNLAKEQQSCALFNGLLNPSLIVMDLTLWTGKSRIYPVLQQNRDVGIQCEFYYPQLSHGMFTYDVRTGRIVQRSVFCDPSENKSKCFGVWDYFWKFAVDPVKGPINYGVGCSLTDWMNQGFVCVNGIDLKSDSSGKLMRSSLLFSVEGDQIGIVNTDIKDEFQNALGANGKTIIDNVKQKCAKVKEK